MISSDGIPDSCSVEIIETYWNVNTSALAWLNNRKPK